MTTTSQNGWSVAETSASTLLYTWVIPTKNGTVRLRLRRRWAGFVLAHFALWYAENVEPLAGGIPDDWGYAFRPIRGQRNGYSNHASGTAMDLNATQHPLGKVGTFTRAEGSAMRAGLRRAVYRSVLRWGGDYHDRKDEMHVELVARLAVVRPVARALAKTPRGKRLLAANPSQKEYM